MKYGLQVKVNIAGKFEWRDIRPSNDPRFRSVESEPYRFADRGEAERMARICYGGDPDIVRIVESPDVIVANI